MRSKSGIGRAVFVALAVFALSAWAVQAHTKLEKSEPADGATLTKAPTSLQLFFNEKPDLKVSKVEMTGPSGKVELGPAHSMADKDIMAAIKGALGNGKYTVSWQAAGDDGHVQKGQFSFTVQQKAQ
jgi:methionine-rich copper-binding protein CopC